MPALADDNIPVIRQGNGFNIKKRINLTTSTNVVTAILNGTGAPTATAPIGSLYLRTDGSSTTTRAYINTDGGTTWTSITTAA